MPEKERKKGKPTEEPAEPEENFSELQEKEGESTPAPVELTREQLEELRRKLQKKYHS
ncbi:MAG TPA: hypothetical protein VKB46_05260 [Pyrinomonadaceae bacterium]|nr:hypothetical protein [Pyrinomonadaceae bacterium]